MSGRSVSSQPAPPRLHFRVPPEPSHLLRARERLRDYLRQYCTDGDVIDDIVICVEEACTNAIRHGGSPDDIEIALHFTHTKLVATVKDRGRGFDVASFDPKVAPNPTSDHGRGLFIIASLMDDLDLSLDGGLEVRMARKAEPRCEPTPLDSGLGERVAGTLGHREARTRATLEQIDEGFIALDWEYRYLYANEPACRLLERTRDQLLGHKLFALFARLRGSELERGFRAAMELGRPSVLEWRSPVIGGWVEVRIYPTPAGVTAYFHDITQRKRADEQREHLLEESQMLAEKLKATGEALRRQAELLDLCFEAIIVWRLGGAIESWNRGAQALYGYSADEALGRITHELLQTSHPQPWATIEAALRKQGSWEGELVHRTKDGRQVVVLTRHQLVRGADGVERVLESNRNITERKQSEIERERLVADLQAQSEELQAQGEELQAQSEEMAVQNEELIVQRETIVRESELRAGLNAIAGLLHSTLEPDEVISCTLAEATHTLNLDGAAIELREEDAWPMRYADGLPSNDLGRPLTGEPVIARLVAATGEVLVLDDASRHETVGPFAIRYGIRSLMAAPLVARKEILGVLLLVNHRDARHFEAAEVDFARRLGMTVGQALENARLFESEAEAQRRAGQELQTANLLLEAATAVTSWTDLGRMLSSLGDLLLRSTDHSRVLLELWDEQRREVEIAVSRGAAATPKQRFAFDGISDGAKQVIQTMQTVVIDYAKTGLPEPQKQYVDEHAFLLMLVVPIVYRERLVGLITVDQPGEPRPFSSREIKLVEAMAAQAGAAIENARLFEAELAARRGEARRAARLAVLKEVADAAASSLDRQTVASAIVHAVNRLLGARQVQIRLANEDGTLLESAASVDPEAMLERLGAMAVDADTETALCFRSGQRKLGGDLAASQVSAASRQNATDAGVRAYILLPLIASGKTIGTFYVAWAKPRNFPAEELSFLEAVATESATGLENARLFEREREAATLNAALSAIDRAIHSSLDFAEVMQRALREGAAVIAAETAGVSMHEDEARQFRVAYIHNYPPDKLGILIPDADDTHGVEAMRKGKTIAISDTHDDPRVVAELMDAWNIKSVICAPLVVRGSPIAVAYFNYHKAAHRFSEQEIEFVTKLASSLSGALENAQLHEREAEAASLAQVLNEMNGLINSTLDAQRDHADGGRAGGRCGGGRQRHGRPAPRRRLGGRVRLS